MKSERVKIYKFDADGNGQVVAEAINGDLPPSLKGLSFSAGDIPGKELRLTLVKKLAKMLEAKIDVESEN
ncbi:MAG: hypothetical protein AAFQ14_02140 [Cyanobacteria bacterium J06621_12]